VKVKSDGFYLASLLVLLLMNLIDSIATAIWITMGVAVELNPLMGYLLDFSPSVFVVTKNVLVMCCVLVLWRLRHSFLALPLVAATSLAYFIVTIIHVYGLHMIVIT
jgi:hypothetical protein